jgi:hypothetical protein
MSSDTTSANLHKNGHNGLNNNRDEYKMDMKTHGSDKDKVAEEDPLTGHQKWQVIEGAKESSPPRWRHRLASTNFFMVIFLLAFVLQGETVEMAKLSAPTKLCSDFQAVISHISSRS